MPLRSSFEEKYTFGLAGECRIAQWLRSKGNGVLPVYEKIVDSGKGPRLFLPDKELIVPDLFVFNRQRSLWIEAKHKTAFTWHRKTNKWVTGIDLRHYHDYLEIMEDTPWKVWLLFLQEGGQAKDSPPNSPAGLFGNDLAFLSKHESHQHENGGTDGMVYWANQALIRLAPLDALP